MWLSTVCRIYKLNRILSSKKLIRTIAHPLFIKIVIDLVSIRFQFDNPIHLQNANNAKGANQFNRLVVLTGLHICPIGILGCKIAL